MPKVYHSNLCSTTWMRNDKIRRHTITKESVVTYPIQKFYNSNDLGKTLSVFWALRKQNYIKVCSVCLSWASQAKFPHIRQTYIF